MKAWKLMHALMVPITWLSDGTLAGIFDPVMRFWIAGEARILSSVALFEGVTCSRDCMSSTRSVLYFPGVMGLMAPAETF